MTQGGDPDPGLLGRLEYRGVLDNFDVLTV
jgi:hypothetical protein